MSKIGFPGGGGAGGGGGAAGVDTINGESGALTLAGASGITINTPGTTISVNGGDLLPLDGSRSMAGNLLPDGSGTRSFGEAGTPWSSGLFEDVRVGGDAHTEVAPFAVASGGVSGTVAGGFTGDFTPKDGVVQIAHGNIYIPNEKAIYYGNAAGTTFQKTTMRDQFNRFFYFAGNGSGIMQFDTSGRMGLGNGITESGLGTMDGNVGTAIFHNARTATHTKVLVHANSAQDGNPLFATKDTDNNEGMHILQSGIIVPATNNTGSVGNEDAGFADMYAETQMYISGVAVGDFLSAGGGGGNPVDSRAVTGSIVPDAVKTYGIGDGQTPFGSGLFDELFVGDATSSGVSLRHAGIGSILEVRRASDLTFTRVQANDFKTGDSDANLTGDGLQVSEDSFVAWTNGDFESSTKDIYLRREASGILQVGDEDNAASGAIHAASGTFNKGVTLEAPNGSGWTVTIDNDGVLTTSGPFVL